MHEGPKQTQHHGSRGVKRRKYAQPIPEKAAKKGGLPVGMMVMAGLGLTFVCYLTNAGNVQTGIDGFLSEHVNNAHKHDAAVASVYLTVLPYVLMAMGVAAIYVVLSSMGVGKSTKKKVVVLREELTVHEFAELAQAQGVGARVAREMYRMLCREHGERQRSVLGESFAERGVSSETVWGMFEELVQKSGGMIQGKVGVEVLGTPMEMMQAAEACVERAALERRAALRKAAETLEERHRTVVPVPVGGGR